MNGNKESMMDFCVWRLKGEKNRIPKSIQFGSKIGLCDDHSGR